MKTTGKHLSSVICAAVAAYSATVLGADLFDLHSVRLTGDTPFTRAVKADAEYMKSLDCDRLLAPFMREAGLPQKARSYGNWESCGLDGHTLGHYLSALSNMIASGNDADGEFRRRLDYIVQELAKAQAARGDGSLDGIPNGREVWAALAKGDIGPTFKRWVPWYNVHKTFAGLRDAYLLAGNEMARDVLVKLGDWAIAVTARVSEQDMQRMLGHEIGGMNETLADIAAITNDRKYIRAAERFTHREIVDPLYRHEDRLTGKHANTQIPKIVGLARMAAMDGDTRKFDAADFFWHTVVGNRSVAFGGNSVAEHFHGTNDFMRLLEHREGPETCNTYNMLRLTERLFERRPDGEYCDYVERALFNHLLSAVNPVKPGFVYFTPIRPEHYRVYSTPQNCFWCCTGTGLENPGKYGQFIYARDNASLYVNLFVSSTLSGDGFRVTQKTDYPYGWRSHIVIENGKGVFKNVKIRKPAWCKELEIEVNGATYKGVTTKGYTTVEIPVLSEKTVLNVFIPMTARVEMLPDGSGWGAIMFGPMLLAHDAGAKALDGLFADDSRMGHVAHGPTVPLNEVPSLLVDPAKIASHIGRTAYAGGREFPVFELDRNIVFDGRTGKAPAKDLELVPFSTLHERRYQIYWEFTTRDRIAARAKELAAAEKLRAERDAATVDKVVCGEQQPETEHDLWSEGATESGLHAGRHWRHGGYWGYTLDAKGRKNLELELTCWSGDAGREFDVEVNGKVVGRRALNGSKKADFETTKYQIPASAIPADGKLKVRFRAVKWLAGGIYEVRLLKR